MEGITSIDHERWISLGKGVRGVRSVLYKVGIRYIYLYAKLHTLYMALSRDPLLNKDVIRCIIQATFDLILSECISRLEYPLKWRIVDEVDQNKCVSRTIRQLEHNSDDVIYRDYGYSTVTVTYLGKPLLIPNNFFIHDAVVYKDTQDYKTVRRANRRMVIDVVKKLFIALIVVCIGYILHSLL